MIVIVFSGLSYVEYYLIVYFARKVHCDKLLVHFLYSLSFSGTSILVLL